MNTNNGTEFTHGLRNGWPIGVGYFAVSFALGIAARNAGFTSLQASVMSALCIASAGEFAGITVVSAAGSLAQMAVMQLIINARYLLMSCALTQKIDEKLGTVHRMLLAQCMTDEIFGLSISRPGTLNPFYTYGVWMASVPGWILGTCLGVIMGNVLPANVVSALSVGLYGMFLAIIIPPVRKDRVIAVLVPLSMAASWVFTRLDAAGILKMSSGTRIIVLTVVISLAAAVFFPHKDEEDAS